MAGAAAVAAAQPPVAPVLLTAETGAAKHQPGVPPTAPENMSKAAVENPPLGSDVQLLRTPKAQALPYDENYSELADPAKRRTAYAKLKYIPLFEDAYLTLGGESRTRYEWRKNERFGGGLQDSDGNLEQRTRLWGDLHVGDNLRFFGELRSGVQSGFGGKQIVSDRKDVDVAQAFIEMSGEAGGGKLSLRLGRQEIGIGGFKLFDMREGPNVRRSFDAARLRYISGPWDGELLGGFTIAENYTAFDNVTNYDAPFYAARLARDLSSILPGARLEALWVHTKRPVARFDAGAFAESRDTFSLRFNGKSGRVEWDLEAVGQTGTWGTKDVRAGFLTAFASYGLKGAWSPRVGARFEIASGDKNKTDGKMNSYYQLFTRPLTINGELGRTNLISFGPTVAVTPTKKLTVDSTLTSIWRTTTSDGIYGAPGQLIRNATDGTAHHVGVRGTLGARYAVSSFWVVGAYYNHVEAGRFLKQSSPNSGDLDYANFFVTLRF